MREHIDGEVCRVCGFKVSTEKPTTAYSAGNYYHRGCWNKIKPSEQ